MIRLLVRFAALLPLVWALGFAAFVVLLIVGLAFARRSIERRLKA